MQPETDLSKIDSIHKETSQTYSQPQKHSTNLGEYQPGMESHQGEIDLAQPVFDENGNLVAHSIKKANSEIMSQIHQMQQQAQQQL